MKRGVPDSVGDRIVHPLEPVFDKNSQILILGTMPSPRSREAGFYYMHPGNRFWRVLTGVFERSRYDEGDFPGTVAEKQAFLLEHRVALWDVLGSCLIHGASDSSIRYPVPNDLGLILENASVRRIFTTGKTAFQLYNRLCRQSTGLEAICLPSTSGANRAFSMQRLLAEYSVLLVSREVEPDNVPE